MSAALCGSSLDASAEKLADLHGISREAQDAFAVRSHERAAAAWDAGFYDGWVVPVPDTKLERDEGVRPDTSLEKLAKLKPAFAEAGGREPLGRIVSRGTCAVDPDVFGIAPVEAANLALRRAVIGWQDVEVIELNAQGRPLGRGGDLHRRGPGPRRRPGGLR